jgi:NAD(P)-dependent dehydrogenase (short-subunit alcohol dehydrogenase family)
VSTSDRPDDVPDYRALLDLTDHRVVVLGGGSGIGRQSVHALTQLGATVAVIDRDAQAASLVAKEAGAVGLCCDAVDRDDLRRGLVAAAESIGGAITGIVDIIGAAKIGNYADLTTADWEAQLDINLRHAINVCALVHEFTQMPSSIALVGSISGLRTVPKQGAYGVVKAALHMLVVTQAPELAVLGTRINAIAPGWTRTPRLVEKLGVEAWRQVDAAIPRGYAADPSEIAGPLAFLISPLSSYLTGQVIAVDGGLTNGVPQPPVF